MRSLRPLFVALSAFGLATAALLAGCASGGSVTDSSDTGTTSAGAGGSGGGTTGATGGSTASSTSTTSTTSSTSTTTGVGGMGGDGGAGGGGGSPNPGLTLGSSCTDDAECESTLCKPVLIDSGEKVCVTPCTQQSDCGASGNFFCDPITPGSPNGYCVPHSPAHCLSCATDGDCGTLSETCFQAPGDNALACHVDCSLSGEDACPPEYTCTDQTVNGQTRKLCRPNVPTCLDAVGGFCDRVGIPQPCARTNPAGLCLGQRECIPGTKRFDSCDALAPQCKSDCSMQDPAGCMVSYCPGATSGPDNCGACGNVCPGYMKPNDVVTCNGGNTCTFACAGENYDVNAQPSDGCEKADGPTGNHISNAATSLGSADCYDDSLVQGSGLMVSDQRAHEPAINGFLANTGSAPDWYKVVGTGGTFCANDIYFTLSMQGSAYPTCYKMTVIADTTYTCQTGANGACTIDHSTSEYSGGDTILIKVEKTCAASKPESVGYSINGHL